MQLEAQARPCYCFWVCISFARRAPAQTRLQHYLAGGYAIDEYLTLRQNFGFLLLGVVGRVPKLSLPDTECLWLWCSLPRRKRTRHLPL